MPKTKTPRRTAPAADPDDTEEDDDDDAGSPRDFGLGSRSPTERAVGTASPASVARRGDSSGSESGQEVMRFEEAVGGAEDGLDREMVDVGGLEEGEVVDEEEGEDGEGGGSRAEGKRGWRSGERVLGLFGEEL